MNSTDPRIDLYLADGCMRCPKGGTPQCKVNSWREELKQLRRILLDCGLKEELKWKVPCYTWQNRNILVMAAFKDYCALSFFKGAQLDDTYNFLDKPGENTQTVRLIRFTNVQEILNSEDILKACIFDAIEVEKAGVKVEPKKTDDYSIPEEFQKKMDELPALKTAFGALTPGRQKAYILYFSAPKQSKTRVARIEKYSMHILNGKGLYDR